MSFSLGTYGLSLLAGILSTLSPCVLPLVPILIGTALNTHRYGPVALALGLASSFAIVGTLIASVGTAIGLDSHTLRLVAAGMLMLFGILLFSSALQEKFAIATSGLSNSGQLLLSRVSAESLSGQFMLGLVLGVVWSPCVGPTLGATITLASQGSNLGHVALVMALFGLGAGLPLVLLGFLSRQAMTKVRSSLFTAGSLGKKLLGSVLLIVGIMILTGADKQLEALIVSNAPDWLITLTTRF